MLMESLCDTCFHNVRPEELPTEFIESEFCEFGVIGFPNKKTCQEYSKDGLHKES